MLRRTHRAVAPDLRALFKLRSLCEGSVVTVGGLDVLCELSWRSISERRVWPDLVVVAQPVTLRLLLEMNPYADDACSFGKRWMKDIQLLGAVLANYTAIP